MEREKAAWKALAGQMQALKQSPGWSEYVRQLEDLENRHIQAMISGSSADFDRLKGFIEGIRACFYLPDHLIERANNI